VIAACGHPVDFLLHCVLPVSLGPVLLRSHLATAWLWYTVITLHELNDHSGYHLPGLRSPQPHDFHHKTGRDNYGNWSRVLDWLYGTDGAFQSSPARRRHRRLFSLAHTTHKLI